MDCGLVWETRIGVPQDAESWFSAFGECRCLNNTVSTLLTI